MLINIFHGFTEGCRVMQVSGSQPIWGASHSPAVLHCLYQPIALLGPTGGPDLGLCVEPVLRTSGGVRYISGCQARRRRDLGAAVGERGRYGVPVGGVVAVGGGRACAGHPHGLGLAAGTGWQGPYIQLVLQSCRDRTLRSLPPIPSPGRCSWPRTSLLIFQCTAPELCQRATHSLRSARPHGARPAVPMAAVAFLHHAPLATTKKPIAVPRSRAARADVPVIDGRLPRQRRLLNRAILQASSEAISWPSDSIAVGVYLHRLPGADLT